jgi:hypothetical protein
MFDLGVENDEGCLNAAEAIVQTVDGDDPSGGDRIPALQLLTRFRGLTPEDTKKIFDLVVGRLDDPEPTVRMQASQSLVDLVGDPAAAIFSLETALAKEKEEFVRSSFEHYLEKLRHHLKSRFRGWHPVENSKGNIYIVDKESLRHPLSH